MSKRKRKNAELRKRVRQMNLPTEEIRPPRSGNWQRLEAKARRSLLEANRQDGLV